MAETSEGRAWWPWLIGLLVLALLVWAAASVLSRPDDGVRVEESLPSDAP